MTEGNKKQHITDVRVMNYLLQAIPNDIYNSVDACKTAKEMWEQIKRLMFGSELVNIMDRNNVHPIQVSNNTKFLNCLQPEWSKYVTMVRHNQTGDTISYDVLYDSSVEFEPHFLASKARKATKNHDPLAVIAHSNASSSQSHANSSYSPQSYYVTHPSSVVDYEDEYQGELQRDSQEDKLTTSLMMVELTYKPRMHAMVIRMQGDKAGIKRLMQKLRVRDAKYFKEQMLLAMKDEAGSNLNNEETDFMLDTLYGEETIEELNAAVIDDDSFSFDNIDYVEASPLNFEFVSSEVMEIVIPKVGGIEASNDNPIPSYDPIISGTPSNLTPSGESDFFLEFDAFLDAKDEFTSSQFPKSYLDPEGDMLLFEVFNNSLPEFTTFSNVLFDAECESDSSDDQSCFDKDVLEKIVSKPLCEEEIIPMKSLRTHDSSLPISSKI
nr:hypothetical protein [Tanacetum cinerariifolium]